MLATINITDKQRNEMGLRISRRWNSLKLGDKVKVKEGEFMVNDYPGEYLQSFGVIKIIRRYLKTIKCL